MNRLAAAVLAVSFLGCADPASRPASYWADRLKEDDREDREEAVGWLVKKGPEAVPLMVPLMGDDDLVAAMSASEVMAKIGAPAVPALIQVLRSGTPRARGWAAHALGEIGPAAKEAIPALEQARMTPGLRVSAGEAIGRIQK